jgi:hypothetical protein
VSGPTCVTGCTRPTINSQLLCKQCTWELEQALAELPALIDELTTSLTKQSVLSNGKGGGKPTKGRVLPLPFDLRASDVINELRTLLHGWTRVVVEDYHQDPPADTLDGMARFLYARVDLLAAHEAARDIHEEILDMAAKPDAKRSGGGRAWRAVDLAAEKVFVGMCSYREVDDQEPCPEELMAKRSSLLVRCRTCGTEYSVEERRKVLRDAVEDVLATPAEISRAVQWLGEAVRLDQITRWVQAERLVEKGHVMQGKRRMALYRIGDVIELLKEPDRRKKPA